ncbi:hypothetical protein NCC49_004065 [Naganishia albida]|nr:hypothetical protein NCC49_004065 [Naganishia albida]
MLKLSLFLAALTSALAQNVPVTFINQCATTVSPQFLGTGNGIANPAPLTSGGQVTLNINSIFTGFIAAATDGNSVYGGASLIYVNLNSGNYWLPSSPSLRNVQGFDAGFCQPTSCQDANFCTTLARSPLTEPGSAVTPCPPQLRCTTLNQGFTVTFCPGPRSPLLPPVLGPPACQNGGGTNSQGSPIYPNGNRGKCLDLRANERVNGAAVQIYDCNGSSAQRWSINRGAGQVRLTGTNFCLDAGSNPGNGIKMKIWQCYDNLPAQNWYFTGDNRIALTNQGLCLDLTDGRLDNFNQLQTWQCSTGNTNQVWIISA